MKKANEIVAKMHDVYVKDDCVQLMLGYFDYLLLFGNNELMYFRNFIEENPFPNQQYINAYLDDERREYFPYSQIPEHIERVLFKRINFANQILEFEKPYIQATDGMIVQTTVFKDTDGAIVQHKVLNGKLYNYRKRTITGEELDNYLMTGSLEQLSEEEYDYVQVFYPNGSLKKPHVFHQMVFVDENGYEKYINRTMVKFKVNGEIEIENFAVKDLGNHKYEIFIANLPVTMDSLTAIKTNPNLSKIKHFKEPQISLLLNPSVSKEQLQKERAKTLVKTR